MGPGIGAGGAGGGGTGGGAGQWHRLSPHRGHGCPSGHVSGGLAFGLQGSVGGPGGGSVGQKHVPTQPNNNELGQQSNQYRDFEHKAADQWPKEILVLGWSRYSSRTEGKGGVGGCRRSDSSRLGGRLGCRGFPERAHRCSSPQAAARAATALWALASTDPAGAPALSPGRDAATWPTM